jgi:hypothetical protein
MARKTTPAETVAPVTRTRRTADQKISDGQRAYEMREAGEKWVPIGQALGYGDNGGIPAREAMYAYMAANGLLKTIDPTDHEAIVKAKRGDVGWAALSAQTGLKVSDLKAIVRNADQSLVDKVDGVKNARTYGRDDRGADGHGAERAEAGRYTVVRRPEIAKAADQRRKPAAKPRTRRTRSARKAA